MKWDDANIIRNIGYPSAQIDANALVRGSAAYKAHVDELERARKAFYENVSASLEGVIACGRSVLEVETFKLDPESGSGQLRYRPADNRPMVMKATDLTVERMGVDDRFTAYSGALKERFWVIPGNREPFVSSKDCEVALYPKGELPNEVRAQRERERAFLASLALGPITTDAAGDKRELDVSAEILDVQERGFRMRVEHPVLMNGMFLLGDQRSVSTISVRFTDAPAPAVIASSVEGRGDSFLLSHCGPTANLERRGVLRLEAAARFKCDQSLEIAP